MARPRFKANYKGIGEAMRLNGVRQALDSAAQSIAARGKAIAATEGATEFAATIRVEKGTRTGRGKGRPYSRVIGDHPDGEAIEHGAQDVDKLRVLGRAAEVEVSD